MRQSHIYCPLVFGSGDAAKGLLSRICVQSKKHSDWQFLFVGECLPGKTEQKHYEDILFPLVINTLAEHLLPRSFEINFSNINAASITNTHFDVRGYSADLPLFLCLVASACGIELDPNLVATGHLGSLSGDVMAVGNLREKIKAIERQLRDAIFLHPAVSSDDSDKELRPTHYLNNLSSLHSTNTQTIAVSHVDDAFEKCIPLHHATLAALRYGRYMDEETVEPLPYLFAQGKAKFYQALGTLLLNMQDCEPLIAAWISYYQDTHSYPQGCGNELRKVFAKLPPQCTHYWLSCFPFHEKRIHHLVELAATDDEDDLKLLEGLQSHVAQRLEPRTQRSLHSEDKSPVSLPNAILHEISTEHLQALYEKPIYESLSTFSPPSTESLASAESILQALSACHHHILFNLNAISCEKADDTLMAQTLGIVAAIYPDGLEQLVEECEISPSRGFRKACDQLVHYLCQERMTSHVESFLESQMHELDWKEQLALTESLLLQINLRLPTSAKKTEPEAYAGKWPELAKFIIESQYDFLRDLSRSM